MANQGYSASLIPFLVVDQDLVVRTWSAGTETLTGKVARSAVGKPCWEALDLRDTDGEPLCSPSCSLARRVFAGTPNLARNVQIPTPGGSLSMTLSSLRTSNGVERMLLHVFDRDDESDALVDHAILTTRQLAVLRLLDRGRTTEQIAEELGISAHTVRHHVQAILKRLDAGSRLAALHAAKLLHLI